MDAFRFQAWVFFDNDLVRGHLEERLALAYHDAALNHHVGHGAGEGGVDFVEHLHHLDDVERIALCEVAALGNEQWQGRGFLGEVGAAHGGDDFVGLGDWGRDQHLAHRVLQLGIVEALGDMDRQVVLHAQVVEGDLVGDQGEQR